MNTDNDLILITPAFRLKNLKYIAENISATFKNEKEIHPLWVVCIDKYNSGYTDEFITEFKKLCSKLNIETEVFLEGADSNTNYGGALMNKPISIIKNSRYKISNPLLLVLDDDNILSKHLLDFIHENCMNNDYTWWLNMLDESGTLRYVRRADAFAGCYYNKYIIFHRCATLDPSQLLIRLNTLLILGCFSDSLMYDFDFMNILKKNPYNTFANTRFQGDFFVYNEKPKFKSLYTTCYHNGLITDETLDSTLHNLEKITEKENDSYVRVHAGDDYYTLDLSVEELKTIIKNRKKIKSKNQ